MNAKCIATSIHFNYPLYGYKTVGGGAHVKKRRNYKFSVLQREGDLGPRSSEVFISSEGLNQCLDEKHERSVYKSQSLNLDPLQFHALIIKQFLCSKLCLHKYDFTRSVCHLYSLCFSTHLVCITDFV